MKLLEDQCVGCGLPCMGNACPYKSVSVYYCDDCGEENAVFHMDGKDLCVDCAEKYLDSAFNDLSLSEKSEALQIDFNKIEGT